MITKLTCPCGKQLNITARAETTNTFRRGWQRDHQRCKVYYAALGLVERIAPPLEHSWGVWVCGRLCRTLDEAVAALIEALENG